MRCLRLLALALTVIAVAPAFAVQPDEILPDPALETRARALSKQLRCMVCQNQSIDDSDAPLARDLRILVRERLQAGDTDDKVLAFLTARYGDFVLLRPRFSAETALLWLTPLAVLLGGLLVLWMFLRQRRTSVAGTEPPLSESESRRLSDLQNRH